MEKTPELFTFSSFDIDEQINLLEKQYQTFMEPSILSSFEQILNYSTDFKLNEKSLKLGDLVIQKINPYCFSKLSKHLFEGMSSMKWQIKQFSLILLSKFC